MRSFDSKMHSTTGCDEAIGACLYIKECRVLLEDAATR